MDFLGDFCHFNNLLWLFHSWSCPLHHTSTHSVTSICLHWDFVVVQSLLRTTWPPASPQSCGLFFYLYTTSFVTQNARHPFSIHPGSLHSVWLISGCVLPSLATDDPRYLKLSTVLKVVSRIVINSFLIKQFTEYWLIKLLTSEWGQRIESE